MTLANKSQILGVQYEAGASNVKVAYSDSGVLKRTVVTADNLIVSEWVSDGGTIADYKAPTSGPSHPTPVLRP